MKKLLLITFLFLSIQLFSQDYSIAFMYGVSKRNNFNIGLDMKFLASGWGGYFASQGSGVPYTGETGVDYSSICDNVSIEEHGVIERSATCFTFGASYNIKQKDKKRSPFSIYLGLGWSTFYQVSETYYYYQWEDFPDLNEGNIVTYISKETTLPAIELMGGIDFINKGPIRIGIIGGFSTCSVVIGYAYLGLALNPQK